MDKIDLHKIASTGATDIFINKLVNDKNKRKVEKFIQMASNLKIRVHIWMLAFFDGKKFIPPVSKGIINNSLFKKKIDLAKYYASLKGISGIHFDYLRFAGNAYQYKGGTNAINTFSKQAVSELKKYKKDLIISAAIFPETDSNEKYYGQDIKKLSEYFDVLIPMIYKGNYKKNTDWITRTTKWYVSHSKHAKIWSGLQSYYSDNNPKRLPLNEITKDSKAAMKGNANGVILFRWGLSHLVNFKDKEFHK